MAKRITLHVSPAVFAVPAVTHLNGQMSMRFGDLSIPVNTALCDFYNMTTSSKI